MERQPIEFPVRRVVVLAVRPEIDAGRYPVKRIVGDRLVVEADLVADGHDVVRATLSCRHRRDQAWTEVPLVPVGNDIYRAAFDLTTVGEYLYTVEAWVDAFASFQSGLTRKIAAGIDVSLELLEAAEHVGAASSRATGADAEALDAAARALADTRRAQEERVALALGDDLAKRVQHVPDRSRSSRYVRELVVSVEPKLAQFSAWYEMFPRSTADADQHGTLRDAEARLAYVAELGFDVVYLPPIHPIGTAFRKGPDNATQAAPGDPGSPWAIGAKSGGHTSVHPELGTLADFDRFVARARELGIEVALDIAFQASPDHPWVKEHPTWFKRRPDGSTQYAENPPKKYQDVYPFDFESADAPALCAALRDVILFWVARGVTVFRVDNPHTKPIPFWEWCLAAVREKEPRAIFLAEAFTRPKVMYTLAKSGFSQSYTYFTWRTTADELAKYMLELTQTEIVEFLRPNLWPTTPDIFPEHLHGAGRGAFALRLVLAATLSSSYGIYGPSFELMENVPRPGSEELVHNEKYEIRQWDLDAPQSLRHVMARLNRIRREHPALHQNRSLCFHRSSNALLLCFSKRSTDGKSVVLVVVNLDPRHAHSGWLEFDLGALGLSPGETFQAHDLLGEDRFFWQGPRNYVELDPARMPAHLFAIRRSVRTENQFEYFL
jgi:starch synthase (maltosyl-transferring)